MKQDSPVTIVKQALALHDQMVKQMKGVPGVHMDRLADARTVRHCALSLVGEPIMYPRINEMLDELHKRDISTFLVTNAQFPNVLTTCAQSPSCTYQSMPPPKSLYKKSIGLYSKIFGSDFKIHYEV